MGWGGKRLVAAKKNVGPRTYPNLSLSLQGQKNSETKKGENLPPQGEKTSGKNTVAKGVTVFFCSKEFLFAKKKKKRVLLVRTNLFIIHWNVGMKLYFLRKSKQTCPTPEAYLSVIHLARSGLVPIPSYGREVGSGPWNRELADKKACFS